MLFYAWSFMIFVSTAWSQNCPNKCQCINREINCNGQKLTSVPITTPLLGYDKLDLGNNIITTIGQDAFKNFGVKEIVIKNNRISSVHENAFSGLETRVTFLDISDNNLTTLPLAFKHLNSLRELDISGNPMDAGDFVDLTMRHLGTKLNKFHLGHKTALHQWPRSTSHLQQLHTLDLNGAAMQFLPPTAFHSFERTLTNLTIRYTRLTSLPLVLSRLTRLTEFHFDNNEYTGDYGIIEQAFVGLTTLTKLSLRNDGLTTFPFVLKPLVNLVDLSLDDNILLYISDQAVEYINNSRIENLRLQNCSLDRIPGAITGRNRNLQHLRLLDFSLNNIQSLDRNDLQELASLEELSLAGNRKLQYVSDGALSSLSNLRSIDFSNTQLTTVPNAIQNVRNLNYLNFLNDNIECTCDLVSFKEYVDGGSLQNGHILGNCETISSSIRNYIDTFVPKCPSYHAGK